MYLKIIVVQITCYKEMTMHQSDMLSEIWE